MIKKITALFMCLIVFLTISACGSDVSDENADIPEEEKFKDMEEAVFIFKTAWTNEFYPDEGRTSSGDKMRKRYKEAEGNFNATFLIEQFDESTASTLVMQQVATGEDIPDMLDVHATNGYPAYLADLLFPIEDITTIDINDAKWGPKEFRQYGIFNGKSYGFFPYDWEFIPQFAGATLYNNQILLQYNTANPNELYEKDEWTWDNFLEILDICTDDTGEVKITGMETESVAHLMKNLVFSNGGKIVDTSSGKGVFALTTESLEEVAVFAKKLKDSKTVITAVNLDDFTMNGKYAFLNANSWYATVNVAGTNTANLVMDDWGFITMARGPSGTKESLSSYTHIGRRLNWIVGVSDNNIDDFGIFLDFVFSPLEGSGKEAWKEIAKSQFFVHEASYNIFEKMVENCNYDYSVQLKDVGSRIDAVLTEIFNKGTSAVSRIDAIKELVQTEIDETVNFAAK